MHQIFLITLRSLKHGKKQQCIFGQRPITFTLVTNKILLKCEFTIRQARLFILFAEKINLALEFFPDDIFLATVEEPTFQISTTLLEHGDARVVSRPATTPATLTALLNSIQGRLAKLES